MRENKIAGILEQVARKHNCTTEHVQEEIEKVIDECWKNPDPEIHAKWAAMSATGKRPTVEETITAISAEVIRGRSHKRKLHRRLPM